jgi:hypothetical protein
VVAILNEDAYVDVSLASTRYAMPCLARFNNGDKKRKVTYASRVDDCVGTYKNCFADFSKTKEAKNLDFTLEILSKVKFSIQFWTASTRLAAITKTPFILVESPHQVGYYVQELQRIALTSDFDKKKIIICHYLDFLNNQEKGIELILKAINETKQNNWDHMIEMVENKEILHSIIEENKLDKW